MKRLNLILIFIVLLMVILLARVYFLSIKSNTYYEELSKQNYIKRVYKAPSRGLIEDRNGVALAINNLGFSITVEPHLRSYKNKNKLLKIVKIISKHFPEYEEEELLKKYKKLDSPYKHDYVDLIDYIAYDDFFSKFTLFNSIEGIKVEPSVKRYYPFHNVASHVIGYVGKASKKDIENNELSRYSGIIGKNGLEKYYNDKLQGTLGYKDIKVNALNKEIEVLEEKKANENNNLKITIDVRLQKFIQENFKERSGAIIVMDVHNGEILAAASFPEFDNNIFVGGISQKEWDDMRNSFDHPFTNKLVNGLYPPGSIYKMGISLALLKNGLSPNFSVYCSGELQIGNRKFRCWKQTGHGTTDFIKAIRESCDDFFYKASLKVGINKISKTMGELGFGHKTGVDQINEFIGVNPNKEWKRKRYNQPWYIGETVISSIGQGYTLVTPMQIARYTAFLATGKLPYPHFYKGQYKEPKKLDFNPKFLKIIREGMYDVANERFGTAARHLKSKVTLAAKTGTAQVITIPQSEKKRMKESELEYYHRSHAWLNTYGPFRNPQYTVVALVEHGGHGGSTSGPIVAKIYDKLYELGYIKK
ncbi:penicillin-binding protein 2 [Malaciobacter molluscorum]|uniref:penicillin-binding protein 2 n=1 Tax=Malaciobacter molluscorum TaxID=1032072 RepID=UPI00100C189F|nr:penicillin-binding protein 2 [Malaciobacter molluscorum]RXJ97360.1 penicillin-binding protein 2 [Malaciobacter molluscorum]